MKKLILAVCILFLFTSEALPHCQIPCGIYDDHMRFHMMEEDILTVEKSMNQIIKLSGAEQKDYNQIVRWVDNKEHHADKISETATYYFLAQRVTPVDVSNDQEYKIYTKKLVLLHKLIFYSMKAKQTTDLTFVEKMRNVLNEFSDLYNASH